jgi:hypothetical protein
MDILQKLKVKLWKNHEGKIEFILVYPSIQIPI